MNRSLYLLTEGLFELHQLATEARKSKPLLYEGLGYSNFDIVLLEAEDQPGFLTRAADAVKKLSKASKTALVELNELQDGLPDSFVNSKAAIAKAQKELKDMSADTGLSKAWQMMKTVSIKKLYSGDDQPLEKIAEITSDMVRYQQMVAAVIADLNEQIDEISGSLEAGVTADGKSLTDVLGVKPLNMWDEALGDDADFSEARIKKAIATAAKPAKWFSGLKALGGSLGIGFGGDLPFKRYGLNGNKLLEDFMGSNVAAIEAANKIVKVEPDDKKVAQGVGDATEEMGKAAEEQQDAGVGSPDGEASSGGAKPETETGSAPASSGGSAGGTGGGSGGGSGGSKGLDRAYGAQNGNGGGSRYDDPRANLISEFENNDNGYGSLSYTYVVVTPSTEDRPSRSVKRRQSKETSISSIASRDCFGCSIAASAPH